MSRKWVIIVDSPTASQQDAITRLISSADTSPLQGLAALAYRINKPAPKVRYWHYPANVWLVIDPLDRNATQWRMMVSRHLRQDQCMWVIGADGDGAWDGLAHAPSHEWFRQNWK